MAGITSIVFGPSDYNPHFGRGEFEYVRVVGDGTVILVPSGAGSIHSIHVGVAGTLAKFFDVAQGGTTDDTTEILTFNTSAPTTGSPFTLPDVAFAKGLILITTGSNSDITVAFRGKQTSKSSRTFGGPTGV